MEIKNGKLELILGPMFAGKSTYVIGFIRRARVINKLVLVIKPLIDNRSELNRIVSHNKDSEECLIIDNLLNIDETLIKKYDIIVIDEGQFFVNLKTIVLNWVEKFNKHVIISGLDGDFKRDSIGEINSLIPYADKYKKLTALCKYCNDGTPALFSHRIDKDNGTQILIGSEESYVSLCRFHYCKNN